MSYNEEGLIRVKRGVSASKKHPDDKEEKVELKPTPLSTTITPPLPPAQVIEERPSSIILEETPLVFPCYTTGFADLERELAREEQSQLFGKIRNLIACSVAHYGSLCLPEIDRQVENSVVDITERLYYALSAIKDNNWNEYETNAHELNNLYKDLNYYLQKVHREYNEKMDRLFITDERFNSDERKNKILEMAKKYQKPAGEENEKKLEFVLFANRAIRSLAVEHVMEEFINDIMPHARIVLNENGLIESKVQLHDEAEKSQMHYAHS
ncbi:hypothetical protein [Wolbachia endosymbiont (group E) of Neria commutata]|uniref:hypothetical protein n=1 Tax=Wolbachia endosymbiont (group E) of Neria commutata TaxID=3066149 RepID=UPI0031332DCF